MYFLRVYPSVSNASIRRFHRSPLSLKSSSKWSLVCCLRVTWNSDLVTFQIQHRMRWNGVASYSPPQSQCLSLASKVCTECLWAEGCYILALMSLTGVWHSRWSNRCRGMYLPSKTTPSFCLGVLPALCHSAFLPDTLLKWRWFTIEMPQYIYILWYPSRHQQVGEGITKNNLFRIGRTSKGESKIKFIQFLLKSCQNVFFYVET